MNTSHFLIFQKLVPCMLLLLHIGCAGFISDQKIQNREIKTTYYQNGNIEYKSEFKNGDLDGITKYWDKSENLISEATYSNGKLHGLLLSYFSDGTVKSRVNYYYGQKHGNEEFFYDNGQLQSLTEYEEGEVIFEIMRWKKTGELIP